MFTGLIEGTGRVSRLDRRGADAALTVSPDHDLREVALGESIAVDGACLTVTAFSGGAFTADVSGETLSRTTLGGLAAGARVNLERALRVGDRLGGHMVLGHVDAVGALLSSRPEGRSMRLSFRVPSALTRYIVEKGSIAVSGVSLTVNEATGDGFSVNVIPETLRETTLSELRPGSEVNIEVDIIGKYVERLLLGRAAPGKGSLDMEFLRRHGFAD